MEHRKFSRVDYKIIATVKSDKETVEVDVENISLRGLLIKTNKKFTINEPVKIEIKLTGTTEDLVLNIKGVIARTQDGEIGIKFEKVDVETFKHLRNIVSLNLGNADSVMQEFSDYIKNK